MASLVDDQILWLQQISSQDLARTLVRQYLYQHNMFKTLKCFEVEDKQNSKKIIKSTLIKMLCINNLVVNNKKLQKQKQAKSFLLLLVHYLRGKFQERIKRQDYSQKYAPSQKNQKQFSMNGDKLLTKQIFEGNKIKQKNLVDTKRKQTQGKTITQEGFYKKKNEKIEYEDLSYAKKSSNQVKEDKRISNSRPSTANPMLNSKKQEKQRIQALYTKLNSKNQDKAQTKHTQQDPYLIRQNAQLQQKVDELNSDRRSAYNNSAIGKNNKLQSSANTKQLKEKMNIEIKAKQEQNELPIQSKVNENKPEFHEPKVKNQEFKNDKIAQQIQRNQQIQSSKRNQIQQEYFDEFQQEKTQKQNKNKPQQIPEQEYYLKGVKIIPSQIIKNQQSQKIIQNLIQIKGGSPIQQKTCRNVKQAVKQEETFKKDIQIKQIPKVNQQISYQPVNNVKRGGMKLLRKGKELTKQQDATQMIGKDIKLLPDDIKPLKNQTKLQSLPNQQKVVPTQIISQPLQTKFTKIQENQHQKPKQETKKQPVTVNTQKSVPSTTVRQIKLKKKTKNLEQEPKISSKFKFDDNFVDEPINGKKQKYSYEKFSFLNMVIKSELKPKDSNIVLDTKINYAQKPMIQSVGSNPYIQGNSKRKNQKPLSTSKAEELKKMIFRQASPYLPKAWHQGFILSPFEDTFYGLKQIQGGPCGIIAAVQCYFLKHLLYLSKPINDNDLKNEQRRETCLVAALADILWKVKGKNEKVILIIPTNRNYSGSKLQFSSLSQVQIDAVSFDYLYENLWSYKSSFIGQSNHGVTAIIYSIVMTKGIQNIYNQVDMKENPLIGNHGHCTQQLVNLFISGQASSNCFDGKKELQDNFTLHGINQKSQFGFLTVYETLGYLEVGKNLKNPIFPIWIISKQFHYHVIFGNHYLISENNDCQKFDLIYFDGLYTCDKFIRLTFDQVQKDQFGMQKDTGPIDKLPLIQQVLLKKWGKRKTDWNGSTKIL